MIKLLVEKGAKVDDAAEDGMTALMYAASHGNVAIVNYLIQHGANVNAISKDGDTALHKALNFHAYGGPGFYLYKTNRVERYY